MNIRPEALKLFAGNIGTKLPYIVLRRDFFFLDHVSKAKAIKAKVNKRSYKKLKSSCPTKKITNQIKRQCTAWEKRFATHKSDKR